MRTYVVTFKNQVNIVGVYGTRAVDGSYATAEEANKRAEYIARFFDSAVAIEVLK